jgi:hypothetical protein
MALIREPALGGPDTATFVQCGRYFINLPNIAYVQEFGATHIEIMFSAAAGEHPMRVQLTGDDAKKFLGVLNRHVAKV